MEKNKNLSKEKSRYRSDKTIGVFVLAMINVAAVLSLRNLPSMAEYGWSSIFWIALGTILFLVPLALVGAELASGWPESHGVYDWVRLGFGQRTGFLAIWSEWIENVIWFPSVMSFLAATLAFAIIPNLATNKIYLVIAIIAIFWIITAINYMGDRWSNTVSSIGTIVGTIIPGIILILLSIGWVMSDQPIAIPWNGVRSLLPDSFNLTSLAMVSTVILMFAGMEMAGYHTREMKNPQRDYPRATLISAFIIFTITVLGTLAIAFVVPAKKIGLAYGLMQAFQEFFSMLGIGWAVKPMAVLVFIGGFALVSTWVIGPAKGMRGPSKDGLLPPVWSHINKYGVPSGVVTLQAILVSILALLFIIIPTVNSAYWVLSALTTLILCIMYIMIFASAIHLRYSQPDRPRPFKIPGGKAGIWIVAGVGLLSSTFALIVGFFPPSQLVSMNTGLYVLGMFVGIIVLSIPPFIFYLKKKPGWLKAAANQTVSEPDDTKTEEAS